MLNTATLIGRLTRDPEKRTTNSGTSVATFTLAVDSANKDQDADFISCEAWGKTADNMEAYCHKGDRVCVHGSIKTGSYEGKDGKKIYTFKVRAATVEFLEAKKQSIPYQKPKVYDQNPASFTQDFDSFEIDEDDLQF